MNDGEASGVVTAVLEPLQAFDEHGDDVALCNGADDAAHTLIPWSLFARERCHLGFFFGRCQPEIVTCFDRASVSSPAGVSTELPAGARLILNVHYHATGGGPETDSATGLALRWTDAPAEWSTYFTLIGAPGVGESLAGPLHIPAGEEAHVEEYEYVVPDNIPARSWHCGG